MLAFDDHAITTVFTRFLKGLWAPRAGENPHRHGQVVPCMQLRPANRTDTLRLLDVIYGACCSEMFAPFAPICMHGPAARVRLPCHYRHSAPPSKSSCRPEVLGTSSQKFPLWHSSNQYCEDSYARNMTTCLSINHGLVSTKCASCDRGFTTHNS